MHDLRTFLKQLRAEMPEQVLEISGGVPLDYTATALAFALEKQGRAPVLVFEKVEGYEYSLVANLFASRRVVAHAVGATIDTFHERVGGALDSLVPAEKVPVGPVHDIVWRGEEVDLGRLPIPRHFSQDAGAYVTAGMVAARDPDTGVGNLSYARLQRVGPRRLGASLHSRQHLWDYHRRAELAGQDLPVAVIIGAHPAVMIAAAAKMAIDQDEYDLAGAFLEEPVPVCKALTVDVDVPANAEIVLEGYLLAHAREPEGPFGEYTGYVTGRSTNNVLAVTAITMRRDPIFVDIVPGNSSEHLTLGRASKEAWVRKRVKEALPFFVDFCYPSSGTHFHCYVRIEKTAEGQAQQVAQLIFGLDHYLKLIVVVDGDIDPADEQEVLWALATRMQADRDVAIVPNTMCNRLDPSSSDGLGAKMMVDATRPLDGFAERARVPDEAQALAADILDRAAKAGDEPPPLG
ncbi:UbiD family decarboxylase [Chloroflexota bacterium]